MNLYYYITIISLLKIDKNLLNRTGHGEITKTETTAKKKKKLSSGNCDFMRVSGFIPVLFQNRWLREFLNNIHE